MKSARIIMSYAWAGSEMVNLNKGLKEKGYDVEFITSDRFPQSMKCRNQKFQEEIAAKRFKPLFEIQGSYGLPFLPFKAFKNINKKDLVILLDFVSFPTLQYKLLSIFKRNPKPLIWSHISSNTLPKGFKGALFKLFMCFMALLCKKDIILYPSEQAKEILVKHKFKNIKYFPFSVDTNLFKPNKTISDKIRILFAGRLEKHKGIYDFIEATKSLKGDLQFIIWGDGSEKENIKKLINKDYSLIDYEVKHEETPLIYNNADIYVLPTHSESGGPITAVEAAACGLPIILTEGNIDIVDNGRNGFLIDVGSVEMLTHAIQHLIDNPSEMKLFMAQVSMELAKKFDYRILTEEVLKYA